MNSLHPEETVRLLWKVAPFPCFTAFQPPNSAFQLFLEGSSRHPLRVVWFSSCSPAGARPPEPAAPNAESTHLAGPKSGRFFFSCFVYAFEKQAALRQQEEPPLSPPFSAFCNPRYDNIGKSLYRLSKKKYVFPPVLRQRINVHVNGKLQWLRSHLNSHKTERRLLFCLPNYHFVKSLQNCNFVREAINRKEGTALPHVSSYSSR